MKRRTLEDLQTLRRAKRPFALVTHLQEGGQCLVNDDTVKGELALDETCLDDIRQRIAADLSGKISSESRELFVRIYNPPLRLIVNGAVHVTQALVPLARIVGFDISVIDPRTAFASDQRFPGVTLIYEWPDRAMAALDLDNRSAFVALTHDPKLDDPALMAALDSDAFYIGALGSRRTHASRLERLKEAGIKDEQLQKIHAPIGLDLGGRRPEEIALAIIAEIIQTLRKRPTS